MSGEAVALVLAVVGTYWLVCIIWPFVPCRAPLCNGGKVKAPWGKGTRPCAWCKGKGSRVRIGRRLYQIVNPRASKK